MKTRSKKIVGGSITALLMVLVLIISAVLPTMAETVEKDGLAVTLTTDKDSYSSGEEIKITVSVKNTGAENVNNVTVELKLPDGIQLVEAKDRIVTMESIASGDEKSKEVLAKATGDVNTGDDENNNGGNTGTDNGNNGEGTNSNGNITGNVQTGDSSDAAVYIVMITITAAAIVVCVFAKRKNRKATEIISGVVITLVGITAAIHMAYAASVSGSVEVSRTLKINGNDGKITAVVTYGTKVAEPEVAEKYNRVSVHDPSIVKDSATGMYYVFGSHMAWAKSKDLVNWETFTNNINSDFGTLFAKEDAWAKRGGPDSKGNPHVLSGNLWAPDVIWNETLGKWCMYMSVNGNNWYTSVALLTADSLEGDWTYAGTVVYSGFTNAAEAADTDLEKVIGTNNVPDRYLQNRNGNHTYGMNAIDPCVKYDEEGNLWMAYGSWFGGIYMLKLDAKTGLRDYSYTYELKDNASDPYQGLKVAGGNHVSGEAAYMEKIGDYYYLFLSYGGLEAKGGYNMRVFRSDKITGPYTDLSGDDARYSAANTGAGSINGTTGIKLFGNYQWSTMKVGNVAQGHNSVLVDDDGKAYVVYHTRFNDGTEGHQVRVHQMFVNQDGWLVAAPYEYTGETLSDKPYSADEMAGNYEIILHKQSVNYPNLEVVTPQNITLNSDGTVTGAYTGTWNSSENGPYVELKLGNNTYKGMFVEQYVDETAEKTLCFTALGDNEVELWGSKHLTGKIAVDMTVEKGVVKVPAQAVDDITFMTEGLHGTTVSYKSSNTAAITDDGKVTRGDKDVDVKVTATFKNGNYSKDVEYTIRVLKQNNPGDKILVGEYFTDAPVDLSKAGETTYQVQNPFNKNVTAGLQIYSGVSIEFDVKGTGDRLSNILAFDDGSGKLYFTGGSYLGYNALGGYFDANLNENYIAGKDFINGEAHIRIDIDAAGYTVYADGQKAYSNAEVAAGEIGGAGDLTAYVNVLKWLNNTSDMLHFGWGNWWNDLKFNGTIGNVKLYALTMEEADTTGYVYWQDYNKGDMSEWKSNNAADKISVKNDGDERVNYIEYAPGNQNSRGAIADFALSEAINGNYTVEMDVKLTAGSNQETQFAIANGKRKYTDNNMNNGIDSGYILNLSTNNSTEWSIAGTNDSVTIPKNTWVKISADVNTAAKTAAITVSNGDTVLYAGNVTMSDTDALKGIYVRGGRYNSVTCVDNIKVKINEGGSETPEEPEQPEEPTTAEASVTGKAYPDRDSDVTVTFTADKPFTSNQTVKINGNAVQTGSKADMMTVKNISYDEANNTCTVSLSVAAINGWHKINGQYEVSVSNGNAELAAANIEYEFAMSENSEYTEIKTAGNEYSKGYFKVVGTEMYVMTIIKSDKIHCDGVKAGDTTYGWWNGACSEAYMTVNETKYNIGLHVYNAMYANPITWNNNDTLVKDGSHSVRSYMAIGTFDNDSDTDKGCILLMKVDLADIGLSESDITGKEVTFSGFFGPNDGGNKFVAITETEKYVLK